MKIHTVSLLLKAVFKKRMSFPGTNISWLVPLYKQKFHANIQIRELLHKLKNTKDEMPSIKKGWYIIKKQIAYLVQQDSLFSATFVVLYYF